MYSYFLFFLGGSKKTNVEIKFARKEMLYNKSIDG